MARRGAVAGAADEPGAGEGSGCPWPPRPFTTNYLHQLPEQPVASSASADVLLALPDLELCRRRVRLLYDEERLGRSFVRGGRRPEFGFKVLGDRCFFGVRYARALRS